MFVAQNSQRERFNRNACTSTTNKCTLLSWWLPNVYSIYVVAISLLFTLWRVVRRTHFRNNSRTHNRMYAFNVQPYTCVYGIYHVSNHPAKPPFTTEQQHSSTR